MYNEVIVKTSPSVFKLILLITFLVLISIPYLWADYLEGTEYVFGGFLLNPKDGYSYLAKMYQGFEGNWRYTFPFSAEGGNGAYLFLYYLFLGNLGRVIGGDLLIIYHIARIIGAVVLFFALLLFYQRIMPETRHANLALVLALFGSGTGWLISLVGYFTSDLWVAEAYPFLSAYVNPHFPLALAIMTFLLVPQRAVNNRDDRFTLNTAFVTIVLALLLAIILPFGILLVAAILGLLVVWDVLEGIGDGPVSRDEIMQRMFRISVSSPAMKSLVLILIASAPILLYDFIISHIDPVVANWTAQNQTPSPPVWDFLLSFTPAMLFAIPGCKRIITAGRKEPRVLIVWAIIGLLYIYFPFGLQRRFMMGYFIPVAGLAVFGLLGTSREISRISVKLVTMLLIFSLPTNVLILFSSILGAQEHNEILYRTVSEDAAYIWLKTNTPEDSILLASPQTGLMIPALTGRRVLFGHPFETKDARYWEETVIRFYEGPDTRPDKILGQVDYVFYGPREKQMGRSLDEIDLPVAYSNDKVTIFAVKH